MKYGLNHKTINKISEVLGSYHMIEKVILYGSRAKGDFQNGSDIDLTVISSDFTTSKLLRLETQLDDLMLPYKIDISIFHQISNSDLIEHINRVGVVFYKKNPEE